LGLQKLSDAESQVDTLQRKAVEQKQILNQKEKEAQIALKEITKSLALQEKNKAEVERLQGKCNEDQQIIQDRRAQVENELSGV
jgi:dynein heavy chain 2